MGIVTLSRLSHTRLGFDPVDCPRLRAEMGDRFCAEVIEDCPAGRAVVYPFSVAARCVTKREFFDFFFVVLEGRRPEVDVEYWREVAENDGYAEDAPIVGVSYREASAYAFWKGGRLLFEHEYEYLLRKQSRSGFVGKGIRPEMEPRLYRDTLPDLLPVDSPDLHRTADGVMGLVGNARELVSGTDRAKGRDEWSCMIPVVKPNGRRDKLHHAGGRIEMTDRYLGGFGGDRYFNIEPPQFRVAYG